MTTANTSAFRSRTPGRRNAEPLMVAYSFSVLVGTTRTTRNQKIVGRQGSRTGQRIARSYQSTNLLPPRKPDSNTLTDSLSYIHLPRHQPRQQQVARPAEAPTNITPNHWDLPNLRHPSRIRSVRQIRCSILLLPPPPPPPPAAAATGRASGEGAHEYHTESLGFTESPPRESDSIHPADSLFYPSSPTSTSPATSRGSNRSRVRRRRPRISHRITGIYRISATQVGFDPSGRFVVLSFFFHIHLPRHQPRQQKVARPAEIAVAEHHVQDGRNDVLHEFIVLSQQGLGRDNDWILDQHFP